MVNVVGWPGATLAGLALLATVSWALTLAVADAAGLPTPSLLPTAFAGIELV